MSSQVAYFGYASGLRLHENMTFAVLFAPYGWFERTPTGRIIARFSKDVSDIDMILPERAQFLLMCGLRVLSIQIVIAVTSYFFLVLILAITVFYYYVTLYYRHSSRELQRLEAVTRAPAYSKFTELVTGLVTIRAFRKESVFLRSFWRQKFAANATAFQCQRVLEVWLTQLLMALGSVIICGASAAVVLRTDVSVGMAGLAVAYSFNVIINLNMTAKNLALVEAQLNAVERVHEYSEGLELEDAAFPGYVRATRKEVAEGARKRRQEKEAMVLGGDSVGGNVDIMDLGGVEGQDDGAGDVSEIDADSAAKIYELRRDATWVALSSKRPVLVATPAGSSAASADGIAKGGTTGTIARGLHLRPVDNSIQFDNCELVYRPGLLPAISGFSATAKPGQRIGICGRTGAGKSSLIVMLLRLQGKLSRGRILLGGVDIATMPLRALRQLVTVIPQDPVLFSGTLRSNVDVFSRFSDAEVVRAVELAQLGEVVAQLGAASVAAAADDAASADDAEEMESGRVVGGEAGAPVPNRTTADPDELVEMSTDVLLVAGLLTPVAAGGSNWSAGERQLICFARAILTAKSCRILLLDEATATIDRTTDEKIQKVLKSDAVCDLTVLVIAHRMETIADADAIWVMDGGRLAEAGAPADLEKKEGSLYRSLKAGSGEGPEEPRLADVKGEKVGGEEGR